MTDDELREKVLSVLYRIAPEARDAAPDAAAPLREQYDLDSMDLLTFLIGLRAALGVEVPEADYRQLTTLDDVTAYVRRRTAPPDSS